MAGAPGAGATRVLLPTAPRTIVQDTGDIESNGNRGVQLILDVTATAAGTGGLSVKIMGKDPASGKYFTMNAAPAAVVAIGTTVYELFPGAGAASGGVTQRTGGCLPKTFKVQVAVGDATSYTYTLGMNMLP